MIITWHVLKDSDLLKSYIERCIDCLRHDAQKYKGDVARADI
jgi:hypothetical protein